MMCAARRGGKPALRRAPAGPRYLVSTVGVCGRALRRALASDRELGHRGDREQPSGRRRRRRRPRFALATRSAAAASAPQWRIAGARRPIGARRTPVHAAAPARYKTDYPLRIKFNSVSCVPRHGLGRSSDSRLKRNVCSIVLRTIPRLGKRIYYENTANRIVDSERFATELETNRGREFLGATARASEGGSIVSTVGPCGRFSGVVCDFLV